MTDRVGYERQGSGYDPHAVGHERVGRDGPPQRKPLPIDAAIANLRDHQRQLDADGVEVGVSRQALEEVLAHLGAAR